MSAELESRVRRLERHNRWLAGATVVLLAVALGRSPVPQAVAQPKAPDGEFNTVKAAEVLAKDVETDGAFLSKGLFLRGADKKPVASLSLSPAGDAGLVLKGPEDQVSVLPTGILIQSRKTKASFAVTKSEGSYRIVVTDKDGKHVPAADYTQPGK